MLALGEATSARQLAVTTASVLAWVAVQRAAEPVLVKLFGSERWIACTLAQQQQCSVSFAAGVFSVVAVTLGSAGLLFPGAAVAADPFYGHSQLIQVSCAVVAGFFAWNCVADLWMKNSVANFAHHICCFAMYVVAQTPFCPRVVCQFLLYEVSTPALVTFNLLKTFHLENTLHYLRARTAFGILFILFRFVLGVPISIQWYLDMFALLSDPNRTVHAPRIIYSCMVACVLFYVVNVYWLNSIIRGALKARHRQGKSNTQ